MAELGIHDISQLYIECLIRYDGRVVKVLDVVSRKTIHIYDLQTKEESEVPFIQELLVPIKERIGFVNVFPQAIYMARQPRRTFSIGMNVGNTKMISLDGRLPLGSVQRFTNQAILEAINNIYPTLRQAIETVTNQAGYCAFDKQFAVDSNRNIYFKTEGIVGTIPKPFKTADRIVWTAGKDMYQFLLEPDYEKTVRTFEA